MQRGQVVKIRAGQMLEVKRYHGSPGILDAAGRARGRIKCWQKWSFPFGPLGPDDTGPPAWTVVYKRRRMSRFRLAGGRLMAVATERATGLMFAQAPPGGVELDVGHCQSYAEWLSRYPVTAVIHPREGEESPA